MKVMLTIGLMLIVLSFTLVHQLLTLGLCHWVMWVFLAVALELA